jgi:hypothetical protein
MRNISFFLTQAQFMDRSKTVTRRLGWLTVAPGDRLMGCVKCQGLTPGEQIERLGEIEVVSVRREPLAAMVTDPDYGCLEATKEGFPAILGGEFVDMFCKSFPLARRDTLVTRIEFKYVDSMAVEMKEMELLPPCADLCQVCAVDHEPDQPHNQQSLFYQVYFNKLHGRGPTWTDAMEHCSDDVKAVWMAALKDKGVEFPETITEVTKS